MGQLLTIKHMVPGLIVPAPRLAFTNSPDPRAGGSRENRSGAGVCDRAGPWRPVVPLAIRFGLSATVPRLVAYASGISRIATCRFPVSQGSRVAKGKLRRSTFPSSGLNYTDRTRLMTYFIRHYSILVYRIDWVMPMMDRIVQGIRALNHRRLLRRRWRNRPRTLARSLKRLPTTMREGFRFINDRSATDDWEAATRNLVGSLLTNASLFVNVGANVGFYCCMARNTGVRTIAFEPEPANCQLFCRNMAINGFSDDVELFPMAVGDPPLELRRSSASTTPLPCRSNSAG